MSAEPQVEVSDDATELAVHTAERTVETLGAALSKRAAAHLVVTGGGILEAVIAELPAAAERAPIEWARVHVWWGDERYVDAGSSDRNDLPALAKGLDRLGLGEDHIHPMPASDSGFGDDLDAAADSYAAELAASVPADRPGEPVPVPNFDVVLLGIGPDGHCASLFPRQPGVYELSAPVIGVRDSPKPPPNRISLTFPALDAADEVWFVASGPGKAHAVATALGGASREDVPSAGPRGRVGTHWLIDREAAAELPG